LIKNVRNDLSESMVEVGYRLDETNREKLVEHLEKKDIIKFDWNGKWLKGEEYFYILANM